MQLASGTGIQPEPGFARLPEQSPNPAAADINNAPSLGQLHEQPMGLAYIASAPCFEVNGPIRFKRSVSGNRYKAPTNEVGTAGWMNSPQAQGLADTVRPPATGASSPGAIQSGEPSTHCMSCVKRVNRPGLIQCVAMSITF